MITDEKLWDTEGYDNPQNDQVRARCRENVPPKQKRKFPGRRMSWLGMSCRGLTPLVWFKGSVNGTVYRERILNKVVKNDVLVKIFVANLILYFEKRKGFSLPINKRKLFKSNARMVFEQDFASPHGTNANHEFMAENFPNHTPTLHRFRNVHPFWFPPKMDDFWPIERVWAILAQQVFREPRPKTIAAVMRRVRDECREMKESTLTKLVHELPAKMNEIYRLKGKKIPATFDPKKSPYACKCSICLS